MRVPNLVPIGPQAATCIRPEGYTHRQTDRQTDTHTLSYIDIDKRNFFNFSSFAYWTSRHRVYTMHRTSDTGGVLRYAQACCGQIPRTHFTETNESGQRMHETRQGQGMSSHWWRSGNYCRASGRILPASNARRNRAQAAQPTHLARHVVGGLLSKNVGVESVMGALCNQAPHPYY